MKAVFVAINLIFGIPGLLLGMAAASSFTQNPVASVLGVTVGGLAAACLWLAKQTLSSERSGANSMA